MRLLSFLTDIERAILMEANAAENTVWESARMVNFQTGIARLTLTLRPDAEPGMPQGVIVVQHFGLADGSFCIKTHLSWSGSNTPTIVSVYDTPTLNWKLESARIASTWLNGPPPEATATTTDASSDIPLAAAG